ncbi:unnamed protein product [Kuraishia capsulata CBS 1993]|uniref:PNK FHA domain-containing protein n=1 Tax=Kuraishia capsulata CBS 1993 TaxID=1382522 RepID=W6MU76_9ASCO|nr:uncharacterized protein KUCA_T00001455001 [Kuraishia capsulata CBS 1993]CDK25485.1 unnamed protein product [Kuraishia capsulata CBS 1993]
MASKSILNILGKGKPSKIQKPQSVSSPSRVLDLNLGDGWEVASQTCLIYTPKPTRKEDEARSEAQVSKDLKTKVAAFDLDHTLIKSKSGAKNFSIAPTDWKWLFPSVPQKLRELADQGFQVLIFTNQGVTVVKKDSKSMGNFTTKMQLIFCQLPVKLYAACRLPKKTVSLDGKDFRKPSTEMWQLALLHLGISKDDIDMENSFFVGDAAGRPDDFSDSDKVFAHRIGLTFHVPEEYFV